MSRHEFFLRGDRFKLMLDAIAAETRRTLDAGSGNTQDGTAAKPAHRDVRPENGALSVADSALATVAAVLNAAMPAGITAEHPFVEGLTYCAIRALKKRGSEPGIRAAAKRLSAAYGDRHLGVRALLAAPHEPIFAKWLSLSDSDRAAMCQARAGIVIDALLKLHGPGKFIEFVAAVSRASTTPNDASLQVFSRPVSVLEHEIRESLARPETSEMSIIGFITRTAAMSSGLGVVWLLLGVSLAVQIAYSIAVPLSMNHLIDNGLRSPNGVTVIEMLLPLLVVLFVFNAAATVGQDLTTSRIGATLMRRLRVRCFDKLLALSPASMATAEQGALVSRFSTDMSAVEQAMARSVPGVAKGIFGATLNVMLLFWVEWKLAMVTLCVLPVVVLLPKLTAKRARHENAIRQSADGTLVSFVQETVDLEAVIRSFGIWNLQRDRFDARAKTLEQITFRSNAWRFIAGRMTDIGVGFVTLTVICFGSFLAYRSDLSTGEFAAFIGLLINFGGYMSTLGEQAPYLIQGAAGLARIETVLDEVDEPRAGRETVDFERSIALRDVVFSYDGSSVILDRVSLEIPARTSVAFVGDSGSGKSTIVNLLMRFFEPDEGKVMMDGVDVSSLDLTALRSQIAYVPQDNVLFDTSVRENIRMGHLDATDAQIEAAAQAAEAHELIADLPQGYDTSTGHLGQKLSGGQRQRIAIARALVRAPKILILDEATSALDAGSAAAIDATIETLRRNLTVIQVTHRLSSAQSCDRIFVMSHGKIVETGTHDELIATEGLYKTLWTRQHEAETASTARKAQVLIAAE